MPMDNPALRVDAANTDYRIILNLVTDPDGRVLGVVGMILGGSRSAGGHRPLPGELRRARGTSMVKDAQGRLMYGAEHSS